MISGTIAGSSSFTVYPLGEITIPRISYSYYYISYTPFSASGTMWIKSNSTATPVSYQISSYSGMLSFGNSYPEYLSFERCNWRRIETNIPMFNENLAFARCSTLQKAYLYNCTSLPLRAFAYCSSLSYISLPVCTYIWGEAFFVCSSLSQVSLPVCSYIDIGAFGYCSSLTSINLPMCSYIGSSAFVYCSSLSQISLPMCSYIGSYAFYSCLFSQVSLPMCSYIAAYAFDNCTSLSQVSLPVCSYIGSSAFAYCSSLSQISLPVCEVIKEAAFLGCTSLSIITIGYSSVCGLGIGVFSRTKITSSTGSIYVPASLVDTYKSAPNWSKYSAIIRSIY